MGCEILKLVTWLWSRLFRGWFVIDRLGWHDKPTHQIWSACVHPLRKYEKRHKMSKLGWFVVVSGHPRSL